MNALWHSAWILVFPSPASVWNCCLWMQPCLYPLLADFLWLGRVHCRCWWRRNSAASGCSEDLWPYQLCEVLPGFHKWTLWEGARDSPEGDHPFLSAVTLWWEAMWGMLCVLGRGCFCSVWYLSAGWSHLGVRAARGWTSGTGLAEKHTFTPC